MFHPRAVPLVQSGGGSRLRALSLHYHRFETSVVGAAWLRSTIGESLNNEPPQMRNHIFVSGGRSHPGQGSAQFQIRANVFCHILLLRVLPHSSTIPAP